MSLSSPECLRPDGKLRTQTTALVNVHGRVSMCLCVCVRIREVVLPSAQLLLGAPTNKQRQEASDSSARKPQHHPNDQRHLQLRLDLKQPPDGSEATGRN